MSDKKPISPFLGGLSSNGDSSSSEDDDVFLNSRLDVISRNCDGLDDHLEYPNPNCGFLNFKMDDNSISSNFTPSPKISAVRFSLFYCGKYFGEVGLFEPEISVFDWDAFREYVFGIIHVGNFELHIISYCDEDGDKIPIESDEDYQEVIKVAKFKACNDDREPVALYISRIGNSFPNSLRSLVSSSLRRVNSVGGSKSSITTQPQKKDVTTSTSFQNLGKQISHSIELNSNEVSPSWVPIPSHIEELNSPQENYFGETHQSYELLYECPAHPRPKETIPRSYSAYQPSPVSNWNTNAGRQDSTESSANVPLWFSCYMKQFKEDLSLEVSSKIEERFEEAVGNLSATDVEAKLRGLLTGYSSELQNKVLCCCKSSTGHCYKIVPSQNSPTSTSHTQEETPRTSLMTPLTRFEHREDSLDADSINNQDYFLQKLLKREQEILDFLDNTNEKIKQKIKVNNDYADSLRSCLTKELAIEERERVLARIEDFRQRQSRTTNDIKMLQQTMEVNNEGIARLALQDLVPPKEYDAKFIKDETFSDGSKVEPNQKFIKHWVVQNTGLKAWDMDTYLVCQSYHQMKPTSQSIPCPPFHPGDVGIICAEFLAPGTPGIFSTEWRFMHGGKLFGNHLWCTVIIPAKSEILKTEKLPPFLLEKQESTAPLSEVPCLEELVRRQLFLHNDSSSTPLLPTKFHKASIEYISYNSKDTIRQMSVEDVLYYLMYIIRITKPDFATLMDALPLKFLIRSLSRGLDRDYDNLNLFLDKNFIEKCTRDNFQDKDMEECYKELFHTRIDDNIDEFTKILQDRYLHNSFNFSVDSSDDGNKEDTINGRETAPLVEEFYPEEVESVPQCDELDVEEVAVVNSCDVKYECEQRSDCEEYDNFDEIVNEEEEEPIEKEIELDEHETLEDHPVVESNLVHESSDLPVEMIEDDKIDEIICNQLVESMGQLEEEASAVLCDVESLADTEDGCSEHVKESDGEQENENKVGEDCEDECSSSYSEYSESDSSLESEDEDNIQKENPVESDNENVASNAEGHVSCEEEEVEEEEVVEESLLPTVRQTAEDAGASGDVDGDTKHPESSRNVNKDIKKNITSLHENFNQNVEIRLDFEVISRHPLAETSYRGTAIHADALTFQEKHFTVSSRPPPEPVQVPESDDESFDGLVFIKDTDIPSSVPPTEPCSPSNPPRLSHPVVNEYERSVSCSSFSECDDEDAEPDGAATGNILLDGLPDGLPDAADSSIHESESTDVCSESSSSPVVDEASSIYYESSLPEDVLEQFYSVRSDDKKDENRLKSPDANADSGSSTSHTLRDANDVAASESSGSYDVNEAPVVDIAQEESTSEFEYVANVDN